MAPGLTLYSVLSTCYNGEGTLLPQPNTYAATVVRGAAPQAVARIVRCMQYGCHRGGQRRS
jgi:hypothetical protein